MIERNDYRSYFGLFTFNFVEDPGRVWIGQTDEIRIEFSLKDGISENWMGVMYLHGRAEIQPNDITIAEICPLTQEKLDQFKSGLTLCVSYGSYEIGTFEVLYIGQASSPRHER